MQGGCIELMEGFMSNECDDQCTLNAGSRPKGLKRNSVSKEDHERKQGNCIDYVKNGRAKITARKFA